MSCATHKTCNLAAKYTHSANVQWCTNRGTAYELWQDRRTPDRDKQRRHSVAAESVVRSAQYFLHPYSREAAVAHAGELGRMSKYHVVVAKNSCLYSEVAIHFFRRRRPILVEYIAIVFCSPTERPRVVAIERPAQNDKTAAKVTT